MSPLASSEVAVALFTGVFALVEASEAMFSSVRGEVERSSVAGDVALSFLDSSAAS